jgi:hypothetical protein
MRPSGLLYAIRGNAADIASETCAIRSGEESAGAFEAGASVSASEVPVSDYFE